MRTRYLKPGFFENEGLAELPPAVRLLYAGLWLVADRKGRLRDRPARIKGELFPYDNTNVERGLKLLTEGGFIKRYEADGQRLIWISNFLKHQHPHPHEPASVLPPHPADPDAQSIDDVITSPGDDTSIYGEDEDEDEDEDGNEDANEDEEGERRARRDRASLPEDLAQAYQEQIGDLAPKDAKTLAAFARTIDHTWILAAMAETIADAEEPGFAYLNGILRRVQDTGKPPSSLAKTERRRSAAPSASAFQQRYEQAKKGASA